MSHCYYPFGMLMPGRQFSQGSNSTRTDPTTEINGHTVPLDMVLYSRQDTRQVTEYIASQSISVMEGFEVLANDEVSFTLADESYDGSGNEGILTGTEGTYRYGFNGKENDNEVKGIGNQQDYGMRIYDPRLGRFLSLDPLMKKYPNESNYAFVSNSPLLFKDADGRDKIVSVTVIDKLGKSTTIQLRDSKSSVYSYGQGASMAWDETVVRFRQDEFINITLDISNPKNNRFTSKLGSKYQVGFFEGTSVGNAADAFQSWVTKENESERYGYRVFGAETKGSSEWAKGLPKAAPGSESLDLGTLLDISNGMRNSEGAFDLAGEMAERIGKALPGYVKYYELLQTTMDAHDNIEKAIGERDEDLLRPPTKINYVPRKVKMWSIPPGNGSWVGSGDSSLSTEMWKEYQKKHPASTLKQSSSTVKMDSAVVTQ